MSIVPSNLTTVAAFASVLLTGAGLYIARKNGLETEQGRERKVKDRLEGKTFPSDTWGITVDDVIVVERSSWWYRFKKLFTGRVYGETAVTVTYEHARIPGELWEADGIQQFFTTFDFSVEHTGTVEQVHPVHTKFVLGTTEWGDIVHFFESIVKLEEYGREEMGLK